MTPREGLRTWRAPFAAADALGAQIDWPALDVVADERCLRRLFKFSERAPTTGFHMDALLAGERTLVLIARPSTMDHSVGLSTMHSAFYDYATKEVPVKGEFQTLLRYVRYPRTCLEVASDEPLSPRYSEILWA